MYKNTEKLHSSSHNRPMAAIFHHRHHLLLLLLLTFSQFYATTAQSRQPNITMNNSLSPTTSPTSWLSSSGRFAFGFYPRDGGFAVGVWLAEPSGKRVIIWTANRDNPPVSSDARLLLTSDRGIVLQSGGQDNSISGVVAETASLASMLDSGNFVLYNSDSQIIWGTFDSPTDTILGGQRLLPGKRLLSSASETNHSSGRFQMVMQTDGNLVLYPDLRIGTVDDAYWASGTHGQGDNVTLYLDESGFIYMLNGTGFFIYNLTKGFDPPTQRSTTNIYRATLDVDGILKLYVHRFEGNGSLRTWIDWTLTLEPCEVKGICGLNSYCILIDNQANCLCPQSFDFVDPSQTSLGCEKKFIDECRAKKEGVKYDIFTMANTVWQNDPYQMVPSTSQNDCKEECLLDCHCEAAYYSGGNCYKQKLPLQYWRRKLGDSTTALVKFVPQNGNPPAMDDPLNPKWRELDRRSNNELPKWVLIVSIGLVLCSFVVLATSGFLIYRNRVGRYKLVSETVNNGNESEDFAPRPFTYDEIEKATEGFKVELGRGGFGTVYRGVLQNGGRIVAVKTLNRVVEEGEREFRTEMQAIGRTHHRNLVRLLGFCIDGSHRLLVYEYMSNGSLANFIFNPETQPSWHAKVRIAMDIARGILYLHEECETPIIHCDIKPQNILVNEFHCAKISDFGLAKLMKQEQTRTFTKIRGTKGYVAPEWHRNMPVTVKVDVYSFGIVLLEIVCCRRSFEMEVEESRMVLSDWVYDCFVAGELQKLVDNCEEVDKRRLERMVRVGLWCIQDEPSLRPSIRKVVLMLEGTVEIPTPPSPTSFLSAI